MSAGGGQRAAQQRPVDSCPGTGIAAGEALGLRWEDVDLDHGVLRVRRSRLWPRYAHGVSRRPAERAEMGGRHVRAVSGDWERFVRSSYR
jgi:integrase